MEPPASTPAPASASPPPDGRARTAPRAGSEAGIGARIGAIILNYRTPDLALDCVQSLVPELDLSLDRIVVVDNDSRDGSAERLRREVAARSLPVRLVQSPENGGFAAGNNLGMREVEAEAYLLLNSDTRVLPGAVSALWRTLEDEPRAALVGPRIVGPDGAPESSCFRFPSPISELLDAARTGPLDRLLARWVVPLAPDRAPRRPGWIPFAAVLIRRAALLDVGPLDEGFFLYYEDVEWCCRATRAGWQILHEPAAEVVHLHGRSTGLPELVAARRRRPRYWYEARSRFFLRTYGRAGLLAANALRTLGHGLARAREALGTKAPHAPERELADIWRG